MSVIQERKFNLLVILLIPSDRQVKSKVIIIPVFLPLPIPFTPATTTFQQANTQSSQRRSEGPAGPATAGLAGLKGPARKKKSP